MSDSDIVDELDFRSTLKHDPMYVRAADALVTERLIADKLYRAISIHLDKPDEHSAQLVEEALLSYRLASDARGSSWTTRLK